MFPRRHAQRYDLPDGQAGQPQLMVGAAEVGDDGVNHALMIDEGAEEP